MPVIFTEGIYPYSTLVEDVHGNLHLFKGLCTPSNHPTLPTNLNKEADVFIQSEACKEDIKSLLPEEQKMHLAMGYVIQTRCITDEIFYD